jgi:hypothetical protein
MERLKSRVVKDAGGQYVGIFLEQEIIFPVTRHAHADATCKMMRTDEGIAQ